MHVPHSQPCTADRERKRRCCQQVDSIELALSVYDRQFELLRSLVPTETLRVEFAKL